MTGAPEPDARNVAGVNFNHSTAVFLAVLAVLAYLGRSLVMLASVGGIAVALWLVRKRGFHAHVTATIVGAVAVALVAELAHLLHHAIAGDQPGHTGFWASAVLVGLINGVVVVPAIWLDSKYRNEGNQA